MGPRGSHQSAARRENRSISAVSMLEARALRFTMRTFSLPGRRMLQGSDLAVMNTRLFGPAPGLTAPVPDRLLAPFGASGNVNASFGNEIRRNVGCRPRPHP